MGIRAKFRVQSVTQSAYSNLPVVVQEEVMLRAVYSDDKLDPNHSWSQATPSGELKMTITNPDAIGALEIGVTYYLDITEAE